MLTYKNANLFDTATRVFSTDIYACFLTTVIVERISSEELLSWIRKIRVILSDNQALHASQFGTQSKQSSKQPYYQGMKTSLSFFISR